MTINEAIAHALEVAEQNEKKAKYRPRMDYYDNELESREDCLKHASDLRQLAEWLTELKEARKLLTATKYKVEHEEWDMHGEHYIGDYAMCPNCNKNLAIIHNGKAEPTCLYCSDCGQKIDWES